MRSIIFLSLTAVLLGCQQKTDTVKELQDQIDRLEHKLSETYKPGVGDFMGSIQEHHAKLWFAGKNENWELADFEIHEIEERMEALEKLHAGRDEVAPIAMIYPALDSVSAAVKHNDVFQFERSYDFLTNTCNSCHKATNHGFVEITIPSLNGFSNQRFTVQD